ncbi:hypothetical protein ACG33_11755 [Steroidobacter denitrificans]|uniref:DUF35 domain-containing protein n=1 Tax=Steroidobacter denitrificans TaxID=465721 RepID=A0A127FDR0_STEDE|nr:Zn-ribbon domain-containing OB-fold protein [Steroidobacter denitrificans]AMN47759.1 hypothetical protein ACG33_11755 [Steroidobacter denitrificans]
MAGDEKMIASWPLPTTNDHDAPFWQGARRGVVVMEACGSCGKLRFPPRPMCPSCHSRQQQWRELSGRGRIWSFIVPHPPLFPVFNPLAPYNVIVVELEEEPAIRLVGNLVSEPAGPINGVSAETIRIGEPVQAVFVPVTDDVTLIRWIRRR